jgi:phosphatidylethanolamine-binding protein (PEBP) family uncharacterized protein
MFSRAFTLVGLTFIGTLTACSAADVPPEEAWAISSPVIMEGMAIPLENTCEGRPFPEGASPALTWNEGPPGTLSYAIVLKHLAIVEGLPKTDPNYFKGFMWAIWDIPANVHSLPANLSREAFPPAVPGAQQWSIRNQFGYFAPCPNADPATVAADPTSKVTEGYGFSLYALDTANLTLPAKQADVGNYTMTLTEYLDVSNIGTVMLRAVSNAVAGVAPVPVDMAALKYPAGTTAAASPSASGAADAAPGAAATAP